MDFFPSNLNFKLLVNYWNAFFESIKLSQIFLSILSSEGCWIPKIYFADWGIVELIKVFNQILFLLKEINIVSKIVLIA